MKLMDVKTTFLNNELREEKFIWLNMKGVLYLVTKIKFSNF